MYQPNTKEQKTLDEIESTYYMPYALGLINREISNENDKKIVSKKIFDKLHDIMRSSQNENERLLQKRKNQGEIKNISQAKKAIVGAMLPNLVKYTFIQNKIYGNIRQNIYITSKPSEINNFKEISTIYVGEETQKPDCDIIIYTKKENRDLKKCIILSLKTSLRERAGQTYKWKLLMEIATTENPVKEKYNLRYNPENMPLVCFATANFYDEINSPQHKGMFKFFDNSFIAKEVSSQFINPLSCLVDYVNEKL